LIALFGLILGIVLGIAINVNIPADYSPYFTAILLISLDSVFSSVSLILKNKFNDILSLVLFLGNVFIGIILILLSSRLGIDLQFALYVVLTFRIISSFSQIINLGYTRFLNKISNKRSVKNGKCQ